MTLHKLYSALLIFSLLFLSSCDLIQGIFKAGFWSAIILVLLIVFLVGYAFYKFLD